jgi:chorismate lyase/3-hydroxybenzoate synthase
MPTKVTTDGLQCTFTADDDGAAASALGIVRYTTEAAGPDLVDGTPTIGLPMVRSTAAGFCEVWRTGRATQAAGRLRGLCYACDGDVLFIAGGLPPAGRYRQAVRNAYLGVLDLTRQLGYPYLFRMWNVIGGINEPNTDGLETYRDFCQGRAEAFETSSGAWAAQLPAATGIGAVGGGIGFYCLASRTARPTHLENPRQVPAYQYPPQYGPRSPSFARASYLCATGGRRGGTLYLSGTASVVGHATVYPGDLGGQFETTVDNLRRLLAAARVDGGRPLGLDRLRLAKVYVRHERDIPFVRQRCTETFGPATAIRYLNVDICRADLLLEIEGIAQTWPG